MLLVSWRPCKKSMIPIPTPNTPQAVRIITSFFEMGFQFFNAKGAIKSVAVPNLINPRIAGGTSVNPIFIIGDATPIIMLANMIAMNGFMNAFWLYEETQLTLRALRSGLPAVQL